MTDVSIELLEKIVDHDGDCFKANIKVESCRICPLKSKCYKMMLTSECSDAPLIKHNRSEIAKTIMIEQILLRFE